MTVSIPRTLFATRCRAGLGVFVLVLALLHAHSSSCGRSAESGRNLNIFEKDAGEPRVSNGRPVKPFAYPWVAQIQLPGKKLCGGALVSCNTVVTAAHCIEPFSTSSILNDGHVILGNLKKDEGRVFGVSRVTVHPDFNADGFDASSTETIHNDIAVIKLDGYIDIKPVRLPRKSPRVGKRGYVLGWGETESSSSSPVLREALLQVIQPDACSVASGKQYFDPKSSICTGSGKPKGPNKPKGPKKPKRPKRRKQKPGPDNRVQSASACRGDSGGPFVDSRGRVLWGIISYAFASDSDASDCGDPRRQTVVASVPDSLDFIRESIISDQDACRPSHKPYDD
jgi:hypothetical protein